MASPSKILKDDITTGAGAIDEYVTFYNCVEHAQTYMNSGSFNETDGATENLKGNLLEYFKIEDSERKTKKEILLWCVIDYINSGLKSKNTQVFVDKNIQEIIFKVLLEINKIQTTEHLLNLLYDTIKSVVVAESSEFMKKRRRPHGNLPVIIWQTKNSNPTRFFGKFVFHECQDELIEFNLNFSDTNLKHATSSGGLFEMFDLSKRKLVLKGKLDISLANKSGYAFSTGLIYCGIVLPQEKLDTIPSKPLRFVQQNRYGSIVLVFTSLSNLSKKMSIFNLGTKRYWKEYSQTLLVGNNNWNSWKEWYLFDPLTSETEKLESYNNSQWSLKYCLGDEGCWTHPEVAFLDEIEFPVGDFSITFEKHDCVRSPKCFDCQMFEKKFVWVDKIVEDGTETIRLRNNSDKKLHFYFSAVERVALFKFAASVTIDDRKSLEELKNSFREDDFNEILDVWLHNGNTYYTNWRIDE